MCHHHVKYFPRRLTDKTVKLWKVYEKTVKQVAGGAHTPTTGDGPGPALHIPKMVVADTFTAASPKRIFANAHTYHINSISINSDGETFLSADDLRINLWNFGVSDQSFSMRARVCVRGTASYC